MSSLARITVIVVSYNTRELLLECLASVIESAAGMNIELIVVDNASEDGSIEAVSERHADIRTIANATNVGFGAACNQAIRATSLPYILLINSDARLTPEALRALYDCLQSNPRCGAAGCRLIDAEGREVVNTRLFLTAFNQALELAGIHSSRTGRPRLDENLRDCSVDWIDGACLFLRREALDEVGLFDERFFMYSEDEDLCRRLKLAGWSICFSAAGTVIHHGGASSAKKRLDMLCQFYLSQMLFLSKHRGSASVFFFTVSMRSALALKYAVRWLRREKRVRDELAERLESLGRARRLYLSLNRSR
jgi:GT2 family glycosyltransferase